MAGHHKGRPTRGVVRQSRQAQRLAAARTPEERLAAAYDGFRSVVSRLKDRAEASRLTSEAERYLRGLTPERK